MPGKKDVAELNPEKRRQAKLKSIEELNLMIGDSVEPEKHRRMWNQQADATALHIPIFKRLLKKDPEFKEAMAEADRAEALYKLRDKIRKDYEKEFGKPKS